MTAEQLAQSLGNAKRYARGWLASCPVLGHGSGNGDRHPSLAITQNGDKWLFKCFGGCDQSDVFAAMKQHLPTGGLNWNRPAVARDPLSGIRPIVPPNMKEVTAWDYVDEFGEVTAQKVRYELEDGSKTYRQYHIMNGERVPTIRNWTPIPYNLPAMIAKPNDPVFICEGEKAAEFLAGFYGVVAVSAHQGSSDWPVAITPWFHGRLVVVIPDNDIPGWKYAKRVVRALLGTAQAIKVVDLADDQSAIGDDAVEYIEGHTFEQFKATVALASVVEDFEELEPPQRLTGNEEAESEPESVAPEPEPFPEVIEAQAQQRYKVEMWRDAKDEPVKWLVDRIVPQKAFMALYGPPGTFKSFIALHLAAMIASGSAWLAHEVHEPGEVLYIAGEGHGGIGTRIAGLRHAYELTDIPVGVIRSQVNLRSSDQDFEDLIIAIKSSEIQRPKLIIIDTLARAFGGGNENASEDMGSFISNCGRLQEATGAALLVVHHSGKDASLGLRGHSSFLGAVDTQIEISRHVDQMSGTLKVTKQKDGKDGVEIHFSMDTVSFDQSETSAAKLNLGFEDDSSATLVVKPFDGQLPDGIGFKPPQGSRANAGRGKHQSMGREALRHIVKVEGQYQIVQGERHRAVTLDRWRDEVYARLGSDVEESDKRKRWKEIKDKLVELGFAAIRNDLAWIKPVNEEGF
jgi:hypothetical protein